MIKSPKSLSNSTKNLLICKRKLLIVSLKNSCYSWINAGLKTICIGVFVAINLCHYGYSQNDIDFATKTKEIINVNKSVNFYEPNLSAKTGITFAPPLNDNCAGAETLTVNSATTCTTITNGTTIDATQSQAGCNFTNADDDVWYKFTATQASHIVTVTPGTLQNPVFQVFSGTCAGLTSIVCRNNSAGNTTAETATLTGLANGGVYFVRVYSVANTTGKGTFSVCVTSPAITYCTPATTSTAGILYINSLSFLGTLNDVANLNSSYGTTGFQDFTGLTTKSRQAQGEGMNVYVEANAISRIKAWVDWNKDGDFVDAGEEVYNSRIGIISTTFGYVIPATANPGEYRLRIRNYRENPTLTGGENYDLNFSPCEEFGSVLIGLLSTRYGEAEDYAFTVSASCSAIITSVTDGITCGNGSVTLVATGSSGVTEYRWYSAATGGSLLATTPTGTWTTPSISTTTTYYVTAFNGCESVVRTAITAEKNAVPNIVFTPASPVLCGENSMVSLLASGDIEEIDIINEHFESGLGLFSNVNYTTNTTIIDNATAWQSRISTYIPTGQVWFPAVSSGFGTNKFVMATSDVGNYTVHNALLSPTVSSVDFLDLTLTFKMYYSHYLADGAGGTDDYISVEVSTNGGTNWTEVTRYISDIGIGTRFQELSFNLNSYKNITNLKLRIRYYGVFRDGVAVDNFRLFGNKQLNTAFQFTSNTAIDAYTDVGATIPYNPQINPSQEIYLKPTLAQLENASFTITATAVLSNGCTATKNVIIENKTKTLFANTTNWNSGSNWKPSGVPTSDNCIIVNGNVIISGTVFEAYGKSINVKSSGNLTVNQGNTLTISDAVKVDSGGIFTLENTSSLVQINNIANSGYIKANINTKPMRRYDFTYWSSPLSPQILKNISPLTLSDKYFSWNTATQNWQVHNAGNITMIPAKGYIVRAPQTYSTTSTAVHTAVFEGVPHNGPISINVVGNSSNVEADYQWNLIGNPYPSAVDADLFLSNPSNLSSVDGTIYLWTHNSLPSASVPGTGAYNYTPYDYATYNLTGGVGIAATADPNNPIPSNNFNNTIPSGYIASGQSFFIRGLSNSSVQFTNTMRVKGNNNEFFRMATGTKQSLTTAEKDRFWLNLSDRQTAFSQVLLGYINGATNEIDRGYDGELFSYTNIAFYSLANDKQLTIQARSLPFNVNDRIPMGYKADMPGTLYISIANLQGLFADQEIYIIDNYIEAIHHLSDSDYSFTTNAGTFNDRFEIVYQENLLGIKNPTSSLNSIIAYKNREDIIVKSNNQLIRELKVFDIQGRRLYQAENVYKNDFIVKNLRSSKQVVIIQIITVNGFQINKRIMF